MRINAGLDIFGKIGIGNWRVPEPLLISPRQSNAFIDRTTWSWRRPDHRHRPVILFDDYLDALSNLFQYGVQVSSDFGFGHVDLRHTFNHTSFAALIGPGERSQRRELAPFRSRRLSDLY